MINGSSDQGNGGGRKGDLASLFKTLRPGQVAFGKHINPMAKALSALLKIHAKVAQAIPDDAGNYNFDAKLLISDTNAILELFVPPYLINSTAGSTGAVIQLMEVVSWTDTDDYFTATTYDFQDGAGETEIDVALPWDLRQANKPSSSRSVQVWTQYAEGDLVLALVNPDFGTGVDVDDVELTYLDLNWGARAWAQKFEYLDSTCATKYRWVVGSDELT